MRQIKFRVWNGSKMEHNIMAGFLGTFYVQGLDEKDAACMSPFNTKYDEVIHVMQSTGIKDKNGKEVYEGDVIVMGSDSKKQYPRQIIWKGHGFWCEQIKNPEINFPLTFVGITKDIAQDETDWEIIGNIHDNAGLLAVAP